MPFGLNLDAGVLLKLDDKDIGKGSRFFTRVPRGCLLPVSSRPPPRMVCARALRVIRRGRHYLQYVTERFGGAVDRMVQLAR
jgi:invasion protein IalB